MSFSRLLSITLATCVGALYSKSSPVKLLAGQDFTNTVINGDGVYMVEFFASWCGHCKSLEPKYDELAKNLAYNSNLVIAKIDATLNEVP